MIELRTIPNAIDEAGSVRKLVENLFYGWGYNAYREENKLRADDALIRNELSGLLGQSRDAVRRLEMAWRRERLPPPSREHPFPDKAAMEVARALERQQKAIEEIETSIRNAAVPENDRVWQRHRNERIVLEKLRDADLRLAEAVVTMVSDIALRCESTNASDPVPQLRAEAVKEALEERGRALQVILAGGPDATVTKQGS
ncbi:MAG: hypothetical protein M0T84_06535 [Betaproteobacteria bacterium]|nr:hypothetical protein [Betaproteobacteria bacterium]